MTATSKDMKEEIRRLKEENRWLKALVEIQKAELTKWRFSRIYDPRSKSEEKST